jgi:hypothetical protein
VHHIICPQQKEQSRIGRTCSPRLEITWGHQASLSSFCISATPQPTASSDASPSFLEMHEPHTMRLSFFDRRRSFAPSRLKCLFTREEKFSRRGNYTWTPGVGQEIRNTDDTETCRSRRYLLGEATSHHNSRFHGMLGIPQFSISLFAILHHKDSKRQVRAKSIRSSLFAPFTERL